MESNKRNEIEIDGEVPEIFKCEICHQLLRDAVQSEDILACEVCLKSNADEVKQIPNRFVIGDTPFYFDKYIRKK